MLLTEEQAVPGHGASAGLVRAYAAGAAAAIARFCERERLPLPPPDEQGLGTWEAPAEAHRAHLSALLTIARYQLRLIEDGDPLARTPQLELWRLREPGHLRMVVEAAPTRPWGAGRRDRARLTAQVQALEAELHIPLTRMREALIPSTAAEEGARAAESLRAAADRLEAVAAELASAGPSVRRLDEIVGRMLAGLPDLERQAEVLGGLDDRMRRSAADMVEQTRPLVDFALNAESAVVGILASVEQSRHALDLARSRFAEAAELAQAAERRQDAVTAAAEPFVGAAADLAKASAVLNASTEVLNTTAGRLWDSIEKADWLALVADGLRHPDEHQDAGP